jgi:hypothetical protein
MIIASKPVEGLCNCVVAAAQEVSSASRETELTINRCGAGFTGVDSTHHESRKTIKEKLLCRHPGLFCLHFR